MNHLQRHAIGYATIGAGVVNVLIEKIEGGWPNSAQQWTLLVLAAIAAFFSGIIAYRAMPGMGNRPPNPPPTNENATPPPPPASPAGA